MVTHQVVPHVYALKHKQTSEQGQASKQTTEQNVRGFFVFFLEWRLSSNVLVMLLMLVGDVVLGWFFFCVWWSGRVPTSFGSPLHGAHKTYMATSVGGAQDGARLRSAQGLVRVMVGW